MNEKTTILKQIMDLLANDELTSVEIALRLNIPAGNCSSYLNTLYNDKRIIRTTEKRPYKYRIAKTPIELLKLLYDIMDKRMDFEVEPTESEKQIIFKIEELIK